jgi:predicted nucleotide-binding protein
MTSDADKSPANTIISRFSGEGGRALLLEALSESGLLRGLGDLTGLVAQCELIELQPGATLIQQGATDNDIYIIVSGTLSIVVNGRPLTIRPAGSHVGEMALIDPAARRSATVIAKEHSLVLRCTEPVLTTFANANPRVWRRIAVELSKRLTERNSLIRTPRVEPAVFVGCSTEGLEIAREIQVAFDHDPVIVEIWTDGVFNVSKTPIEDLTALVARIDFGVLLLAPDDRIVSRDVTSFGPRDNVLFELGLVMGEIGRERTFILAPRGVDFKIPTDLLGVKPIDYPPGPADTIRSRLGPACTELRRIINRLGPL